MKGLETNQVVPSLLGSGGVSCETRRASHEGVVGFGGKGPLLRELGTDKAANVRFWPWLEPVFR